MTTTEFLDMKKWVPEYGLEVEIITPYGLRRAVYNKGTVGFRFLDCSFPEQQAFIRECFVFSWRYTDPNNMLDLKFKPNHWEIQKQGNSLIQSALKKKSLWQKILDYSKRIKLLKQ